MAAASGSARAGRANLDGAPIDLNAIRDTARAELLELLDARRGTKAVVLDPELAGPLTLVVQTSTLKERGVEHLFYLEREPLACESRHLVFVVRPRLELMPLVAVQVRHAVQQAGRGKGHDAVSCSVLFTPRRTTACEKALEEEGVYGDIDFAEFGLDLLPREPDVLTLDLPYAFKDSVVDGDDSVVYYVARALAKVQRIAGTIPLVSGKGRCAKAVADLLTRLRREECSPPPKAGSAAPAIDMVVLLDREVDLVTPLCTQLTYEGLVDEVLRIINNAVEIPNEADPARPAKARLNSSDALFVELRDLNFGRACDVLRERSTAMQQDYRAIKDGKKDQEVSEIRNFVRTIRDNMGAGVDLHATIAKVLLDQTKQRRFMHKLQMERACVESHNIDEVMDCIEEMIGRTEPLPDVLRLVCLLSLTNGGLPRKQYESLQREILHAYGYENQFTLQNLASAGLLQRSEGGGLLQGSRSAFTAARKALKLVVDDMDDANPKDIAYAYSHSGYAPLSVRLVQHAVRGGWRPIEDTLKLFPGPHFEHTQGFDEHGHPCELPFSAARMATPPSGRRPLVLVCMLGGMTFAEISALRFLSTLEGVPVDFMCLTTHLVNGSSLMETLLEEPVRARIDATFGGSGATG